MSRHPKSSGLSIFLAACAAMLAWGCESAVEEPAPPPAAADPKAPVPTATAQGPLELPALPYPQSALEPHITANTVSFHYGKHHAAYVTNLNNLIKGTEFENLGLEEIIKKSSGGIFNNSAQVWNHTFYWNCLSPKGGGQPRGTLSDAIGKKWGSFDAFKELAQRFPNSKYTPDAVARMNYLVDALAAHEVHVARYYMKRSAYVAAVNRAQFALKTYPHAPANEEGLAILI